MSGIRQQSSGDSVRRSVVNGSVSIGYKSATTAALRALAGGKAKCRPKPNSGAKRTCEARPGRDIDVAASVDVADLLVCPSDQERAVGDLAAVDDVDAICSNGQGRCRACEFQRTADANRRDATLKRSVPPLTTNVLLGPSVGGASISSVPLPDFARVPELTIVPENLVVVD